MNWHYHQIIRTTSAHIFLLCLFVISFCVSCNVGKAVVAHRENITCIGQERDALLKFKHHIRYDNCGLMSSWGNPNKPDCCTWKGVSCSNQTGHVIGLYLSGAPLGYCLNIEDFSPSLSELKHLKYLDLSSNYFYGMVIPTSIASLVNLIHLNLSGSYFDGNIPHQLGNLTRLTSVDLSGNDGLSAKSMKWISQLSLLTDINLSGTDLSEATDWTQSIGSLPLLEVLQMDDCGLSTPPPSSSFLQSANLRLISLSGNNFHSSSSFEWLFNNSNYASSLEQSLEHLDLSYNFLQGPIPDAIGNLKFLTHLNLSRNSFSSTIPHAITNLRSLLRIDLSHNSLSGLIPSTIGSTGALGPIPKYLSHFGTEAFQGNPSFSMKEDTNVCGEDNSLSIEDKKDDIYPGLYVSIGIGFYTGFWVFCGTLTLKNSWRHAYFRFLDQIIDTIYVFVAINLARFRRNSQV